MKASEASVVDALYIVGLCIAAAAGYLAGRTKGRDRGFAEGLVKAACVNDYELDDAWKRGFAANEQCAETIKRINEGKL